MILTVLYFLIQSSSQMIIFESNTRGGREYIAISKEEMVFVQNENERTAAITTTEWEKLQSILQTIRIEEINSYVVPSDKRNGDAAWHSTITIKINNLEYSSSTFDNYNSPEKLSGLMNYILKLKKKHF